MSANIETYMHDLGRRARAAARILARTDTASKNRALLAIAAAIRRDAPLLMQQNALDLAQASAAGKDAAFIDRLTLDAGAIEAMAEGGFLAPSTGRRKPSVEPSSENFGENMARGWGTAPRVLRTNGRTAASSRRGAACDDLRAEVAVQRRFSQCTTAGGHRRICSRLSFTRGLPRRLRPLFTWCPT